MNESINPQVAAGKARDTQLLSPVKVPEAGGKRDECRYHSEVQR
jgi:hypothetical protein